MPFNEQPLNEGAILLSHRFGISENVRLVFSTEYVFCPCGVFFLTSIFNLDDNQQLVHKLECLTEFWNFIHEY